MYAATFIRQFCMICVPLFLMITGYLQGGREVEFNKKHILKILKVLIPYIIITIISYWILYLFGILEGRTLATMLFGFVNNGYTWYIEMYIGLFMLIPFINGAWNSLKTKEKKEGLVLLMIFLCFVPNLINAFYPVFPDHWIILYPFAYYLIGTYIKEYGLNMQPHNKLFVIGIASTLHFLMAIFFFKENMWSAYNGYHNPFVMINAIMVFDLLLDIKTENLKTKTKKKLMKIADAVLPAYMISFIVDTFVYRLFAYNFIPTVQMRILLAIPLIFVAATLSIELGMIITKISNSIMKK